MSALYFWRIEEVDTEDGGGARPTRGTGTMQDAVLAVADAIEGLDEAHTLEIDIEPLTRTEHSVGRTE